MTEHILRVDAVSKEFSGFVAVKNASLNVKAGTVHGLIGPNGAGKSTLFNMITKFIKPTSGKIFFKDRDITHMPPAEVALLGVVRSFQISAVFPHLTVLENVRFALQRRLNVGYQFWRSDRSLLALHGRARELLESVGLGGHAALYAADLSYGRKRALEIATTLAVDPELLLLDEPMAGMAHEDVETIAELIQSIGKTRTVIMVEHNLHVVSRICDTISVLRRGEIIAEGSYAEVSKHPEVMEAYLGREQV